jgi:trimeric autotransporter adhesin
MRHALLACLVAAAATSAACGGSSSGSSPSPLTPLPPDALNHDASALFAGNWFGTVTATGPAGSQSTTAELTVSVTARNTLTFPGFCGDGNGPPARVTSDTAFTVGGYDCPIPTASCTINWRIDRGSGALSGGTFVLSVSGTASGCGVAPATLSLDFSGTRQPVIVTPPSISFLSPSSVPAGSPAFNLQVFGSGFDADAVVQWNGSPRATTALGSGFLQAQITAADVASGGTAQVTVLNTAAGTTSAAVPFEIVAPPPGVTIVALPASDMVWDPVRQKIYLSVNNASPANPNTITTLDPLTGTIDAGVFAGSQPNRLAISGDAQFLYAGIDGAASVERFALPLLTPDLRVSLGSDPFFGAFTAGDIQVAPGAPGTIAVSLAAAGVSPPSIGGVVIFDGATARPTRAPGFSGTGHSFDSLQWGADATALYAANGSDTGFDFYTLAVNADGVSLTHDYGGAFSSFANRIHFDPVTGLVYSDDGHAVDPATGLPAGTYGVSGIMIPDGAAGAAVFVTSDFASSTATVRTFDLAHFTSRGTLDIPRLSGQPRGRLLRWGSDGIAFLTTGGQVVLAHAPGLAPP